MPVDFNSASSTHRVTIESIVDGLDLRNADARIDFTLLQAKLESSREGPIGIRNTSRRLGLTRHY